MTSAPFTTAWVRSMRFGTLAAVPLPEGNAPVPSEVLQSLPAVERDLALAERGRRQIELVGGRLAARAAAEAAGIVLAPMGTGSERQPLVPAGLTVSISHKTDLALAMVATDAAGTVGIDLEGDGRSRMTIASRICTPTEWTSIQSLPEDRQWREVLARFAIKESIYKAVYPWVRHFFGFQAAEIALTEPHPTVTLTLPPEDPKIELEVELVWLSDVRIVALARARRSL